MVRATVAIGVAILALSSSARADGTQGFYYEESGGVSLSRGTLGSYLDGVMHLRIGVGVRQGSLAIEPWLSADLDSDRDGAFYGIGGKPAPGGADLASYGIDAKYIRPMWQHLEVYARGGPLYSTGTGALAAYSGFGFGGGAGLQLTGSVRALGFLFAPLFWSKRGPLVTGGLFIDEGVDLVRLRAGDMPGLASTVAHFNAGFAIGSSF